ncbi:unnamed protein product [Symbiodinium natans]|uniref:Uncharacterized protein n=1 Tax=Symbiodinium natans TaxID=878477 RepID=A0A812R642_9DINO|nr:unnamed protein product [Symbiodinium natans]
MASGGALGAAPRGGLSKGDFIIVQYHVPEDLWHVRLLLAAVSETLWVIVTPQADLYIEDIGVNSQEISAWRAFDPTGPLPYGVAPGTVHGFRQLPDAAAKQRLFDEGERHALLVSGTRQCPILPVVPEVGLRRISDVLRGWGLTVHELEEAKHSGDFVGLHFNGLGGFVSIKPSRIHKIKSAIDDLLHRQFCSGRVLQTILGHLTWASMGRRESLAILNSCYAFVHQKGEHSGRLWPSVRKELEWFSAVLPLLRMKINCGWSQDITASDSSPWGLGVCLRTLEKQEVQSLGGCSERWRFRFEDALRARDHALNQDDGEAFKPGESGIGSIRDCSLGISSFIRDLGFDEVPKKVLQKDAWTVVWSRPWKFEANILHTEARALVWSAEHLLRSNRNLCKRLVCLSDNLPLVLSATKGRGKSKYLIGPLRRLAALGLACGSKVHVRWVPSELNVADAPSRAIRQKSAQSKTAVPEGLTYLESRSVRAPTLADYQNRLKQFEIWLGVVACAVLDLALLDMAMVEYVNELFDLGKGVDSGVRALAALKFFHPLLGRNTGHLMPRTARALKGWSLAAPSRQRLPIPLEGLGCIMGILIAAGLVEMALRLFIQFSCYLRPGECSNLLCKQLVAPQATALAGQAFRYWAILLHPIEDGVPGKTNMFDATVLLDSDAWMDPLLRGLLSKKSPDDPLWAHSHNQVSSSFQDAITKLGLEHMGWQLYNLRHGGATHDVLSRRRSLMEVKQRGRWLADNSVKRYVKQARMQSELARIPTHIREYGAGIIRQLPELLLQGLLSPRVGTFNLTMLFAANAAAGEEFAPVRELISPFRQLSISTMLDGLESEGPAGTHQRRLLRGALQGTLLRRPALACLLPGAGSKKSEDEGSRGETDVRGRVDNLVRAHIITRPVWAKPPSFPCSLVKRFDMDSPAVMERAAVPDDVPTSRIEARLHLEWHRVGVRRRLDGTGARRVQHGKLRREPQHADWLRAAAVLHDSGSG